MTDYSGTLRKGVAPHNVNMAEWTALGMKDGDLGRTWFPLPPANMPGEWMGCLWGPGQLQYLREVPLGATLIFGNEFNLPYEPLHESAEMSPQQAAAMYVMVRWMRPDLQWWGIGLNGIDAWNTSVDGLPWPYFRAFVGEVFTQWLPIKNRFDLPGPFEAMVGYIFNWYHHADAPIPDAWRSPAWAAETLIEAAETAGLKRKRPVRVGEFSPRQNPGMLQSWLEDMKQSRWIEAGYIFTPFDERKPHFSLLRADMTRKATGEVFANF